MTLLAAVIGASLLAQVELRGGDSAPGGVVVGVGEQGVEVAPSAAQPATRLIGWDRVRRVGGVHADEAEAFDTIAERAWRARTRLERGDVPGAEPIFESLFARYAGGRGPTSIVVSEGLLRCRLHRGAQVGALAPWMALLDARRDEDPTSPEWVGADWSSRAALGPVLDESSGLVPSLAPVWLGWASLASIAGEAPVEPAPGDRGAALLALYRHAARFELGLESELPADTDKQWGVQLVRDVVEARTGDRVARRHARDRLRRLIEQGVDPWVEAWCRAGIGRSLVREEGAEDRMLGVLELLHLPARFGRTDPYLSGLAIGESVVVLDGLGDGASALTLASELARSYRGHPVLEWGPLASYLSIHEVARGASSGGGMPTRVVGTALDQETP